MIRAPEHGRRFDPAGARRKRGASLAGDGTEASARLEADRRYALVRVREVVFAFGDIDAFTRALGQIWDAGLVPEPLASALGSELGERATDLVGVDVDLADLSPDDLEPPHRR